MIDAVSRGHRHRLCQSVMSHHSIHQHHFVSSQTNLSLWLKFLSLSNSRERNSSARLQWKEIWRLRIHKQYCICLAHWQTDLLYAQWDQVQDLELFCPCPGGLLDLVCTDCWTSLKLWPYAKKSVTTVV